MTVHLYIQILGDFFREGDQIQSRDGLCGCPGRARHYAVLEAAGLRHLGVALAS